MKGWIKIHRRITKWGWYHKSEMVHLFIHLLLLANHEEKVWQGNIVKRGQCITGRKQLSKDTGISQQTIRTCLTKLKLTNEIATKSTNKFSLITILNYNDYQIKGDKLTTKSTKCLTNNQPTTNQQLTTNKNYKNVKKNMSDKSDEVFSSKNYINSLISNKRKDLHIIGLFWDYKETEFDNNEQANSQLVRHLKPAKALKGYSDEQIEATFKGLDKESNRDINYIWTLETVLKRIEYYK